MLIRLVTPHDHPQIPDLIKAAFEGPDEANLVNALRQAGDIALEYVATDRDVLIGHIAFSRLISPPGCLALAPLSVHPDHQKTGIGSALTRFATNAAQKDGWVAAFVLGDPAYYGRFGYDVRPAQGFATPYSPELNPTENIPLSSNAMHSTAVQRGNSCAKPTSQTACSKHGRPSSMPVATHGTA